MENYYQDQTGQTECKNCPAGYTTNGNIGNRSCLHSAGKGYLNNEPLTPSCDTSINYHVSTMVPIENAPTEFRSKTQMRKKTLYGCQEACRSYKDGSGASGCDAVSYVYPNCILYIGAPSPLTVGFLGGPRQNCSLGWVFDTATGDCDFCRPGTFSSDALSQVCQTCPSSYYQKRSAKSHCKECSLPYHVPASGSNQGRICAACGAGKYVTSSQTCIQCPENWVTSEATATSCWQCNILWERSNADNTECLNKFSR